MPIIFTPTTVNKISDKNERALGVNCFHLHTANIYSGITVEVHLNHCTLEKLQFFTVEPFFTVSRIKIVVLASFFM